MTSAPDIATVKAYLLDLQDRICAMLEAEDGVARFRTDNWTRDEGGGGRERIAVRFEVLFLVRLGILAHAFRIAHRPAVGREVFDIEKIFRADGAMRVGQIPFARGGDVTLAAGERASLDPMVSQLGVTSDDIPVTVSIRVHGKTETQVIPVKNVIVPALRK